MVSGMGKKHYTSKKVGARKSPTRAEKATRKARFQNRRITPMSRTADLAQADQKIAAKQAEIQKVQKDYVAYHDEVTTTIKSILEDAGVLTQVHDLELERLSVQKKAQEKIQAIQQDIAKLSAAKEFLLGLGKDSSEPEAPVAEEPEVVAEIEVVPEVEEASAPEPEPIPAPALEPAKKASTPSVKKPKPPAF